MVRSCIRSADNESPLYTAKEWNNAKAEAHRKNTALQQEIHNLKEELKYSHDDNARKAKLVHVWMTKFRDVKQLQEGMNAIEESIDRNQSVYLGELSKVCIEYTRPKESSAHEFRVVEHAVLCQCSLSISLDVQALRGNNSNGSPQSCRLVIRRGAHRIISLLEKQKKRNLHIGGGCRVGGKHKDVPNSFVAVSGYFLSVRTLDHGRAETRVIRRLFSSNNMRPLSNWAINGFFTRESPQIFVKISDEPRILKLDSHKCCSTTLCVRKNGLCCTLISLKCTQPRGAAFVKSTFKTL